VFSMQISKHVDVCLHWNPCLISSILGAFSCLLADLVVESLVEAGEEGGTA
jgi:hypothetical protein